MIFMACRIGRECPSEWERITVLSASRINMMMLRKVRSIRALRFIIPSASHVLELDEAKSTRPSVMPLIIKNPKTRLV
jgi:hypothetical protein